MQFSFWGSVPGTSDDYAGLANCTLLRQRLFLALNTVKGHNRHIFGKLQVQRRTEAIARARESGLL